MTTRRAALHRWVFAGAGVYNLSWATFSILDPGWFFRVTAMPPSNHPELFAGMAMVVGLYGVAYLEVARVPDRGFVLAAVGLAGKVLGTVAFLALWTSGRWPASAAVMTIPNDVIWLVPFGLYLRDVWPVFRATLSPPGPRLLDPPAKEDRTG